MGRAGSLSPVVRESLPVESIKAIGIWTAISVTIFALIGVLDSSACSSNHRIALNTVTLIADGLVYTVSIWATAGVCRITLIAVTLFNALSTQPLEAINAEAFIAEFKVIAHTVITAVGLTIGTLIRISCLDT